MTFTMSEDGTLTISEVIISTDLLGSSSDPNGE